jgi:homoserine dehydrogenase
MKIALLFVGYGHVAKRFVQLLDESRTALAALDIEPVMVGTATRKHGRTSDGSCAPFITEAFAQIESGRFDAHVLVETTTLDVRSGEPAISHVRAALAAGAHVVTANKGPAAFAYRSLTNEAARAGLSFLCEGAVMDGIPVLNLVRDSMPAVTVTGFRGVVNSTTNFMLTAMENGEDYGAALERMQAAGVAEADPSLDVDGWDAAAKAAVLANVLLDSDTTPHSVVREGIGPATGARAIEARTRGRRVKLVASGSGRGAAVQLRVGLEELAADDPLAILEGQANALELDTWPLGRIVITQRDGGLEKTAYALLADLVTVARRVGGR